MGLNLSAEVDKELWTVTLPWDRYTMTDEQRIILVSAESFGLAECTRENMQDVAWTATLPEALKGVNPHVFMEFGPWVKEMAQQYGFSSAEFSDVPINGRDLVAKSKEQRDRERKGMQSNATFSERDIELMHETCDSYPQVKRFQLKELDVQGPWTKLLADTRDQIFEDSRGKAVVEELAQCFISKGLKPIEGVPGYVEGVSPQRNPSSESIALALKAVECQEETDATPRLAQVWADLQAPIVKKYAKELIAQRELIDERVAEAKQYIQEHPEFLEPPGK
ncbi:hypothetical protein [Arcanobacterium pinnipediorum]|uniref:Uncharacterized protein n=1 Tax=Arcanobacterium pinnipediorum TaxID=1503041 RepID=A0ABY5AJN2_9ACTO|nr:hypothetical protein [Arcanobacterium pinnipediorum]USR79976.1 hypothetical protein NG665_03080 [Arcanobacterium pinnipediorum]